VGLHVFTPENSLQVQPLGHVAQDVGLEKRLQPNKQLWVLVFNFNKTSPPDFPMVQPKSNQFIQPRMGDARERNFFQCSYPTNNKRPLQLTRFRWPRTHPNKSVFFIRATTATVTTVTHNHNHNHNHKRYLYQHQCGQSSGDVQHCSPKNITNLADLARQRRPARNARPRATKNEL
jgi:hypothetical protein